MFKSVFSGVKSVLGRREEDRLVPQTLELAPVSEEATPRRSLPHTLPMRHRTLLNRSNTPRIRKRSETLEELRNNMINALERGALHSYEVQCLVQGLYSAHFPPAFHFALV